MDRRFPFIVQRVSSSGEILQERGVGLLRDGEGVVVAVEKENDLAPVRAEGACDLRENVTASGVRAYAEFACGKWIRVSHQLSSPRIRRLRADEARDRKNAYSIHGGLKPLCEQAGATHKTFSYSSFDHFN